MLLYCDEVRLREYFSIIYQFLLITRKKSSEKIESEENCTENAINFMSKHICDARELMTSQACTSGTMGKVERS